MKYTYSILVLLISFSVSASRIIVSEDIGFNEFDSTSFLQMAFNTPVDTIVVDYVGMDWRTGPLDINRDNVTVIFERDVVVRALPNVFGVFDSLLRIRDKNNISIFGYGATLIMNKQEYIDLADSEFRHGINLESSVNVHIEGLTIRDSGGDGISVSKSFLPGSPQNYCENITIKNCISTNNYRQGLAIISVKDIDVLYCEFSDTSGTLPEDGIDIEPFEPDQRIENVLIKGCRIINNNGNAIQVAMEYMDDSSRDISIRVEDTYMSGNHDPSNTFSYAELNIDDNGTNGVDGFVTFSNCFVDSSEWTAVYISKTVDSYLANFENCVFKDVSNDPIAFNNPIFFEVTDYENSVARFGGATFTNCTIIYDEDIPFLDLVENTATSEGLGDVTGNFYIVNPNNPTFETGINPNNISISVLPFEVPPATTVGISASQISYTEDDDAFVFVTQRESDELYPMSVLQNFDGTATFGDDYDRHPGFVLFEEGEIEIETFIGIIKDDQEENLETVQVAISPNDCYVISQDAMIEFELGDSVLNVTKNDTLTIQVFPNPTSERVRLQIPNGTYVVSLYTATGKFLNSIGVSKNVTSFDMNSYSSGVYMLKVFDVITQKSTIVKLIKK